MAYMQVNAWGRSMIQPPVGWTNYATLQNKVLCADRWWCERRRPRHNCIRTWLHYDDQRSIAHVWRSSAGEVSGTKPLCTLRERGGRMGCNDVTVAAGLDASATFNMSLLHLHIAFTLLPSVLSKQSIWTTPPTAAPTTLLAAPR